MDGGVWVSLVLMNLLLVLIIFSYATLFCHNNYKQDKYIAPNARCIRNVHAQCACVQ